MTDNISKVIDKLKASSKEIETTENTPKEDEKQEEPKEDEQKPKDSDVEKATPEKQEEKAKIKEKINEIELLQNNGIYRAEVLVRLSSISDHLLVLNSILNKLVGEDGKKE